jgi:hypothetical protein
MTEWSFDPNDNSQAECPNCGRNRISLCLNGKHRCEKCDYCIEEKRIITDEEIDGFTGATMFENLRQQPSNLIHRLPGKTVAKLEIILDDKGQATLGAHAVSPLGTESPLSPFITAQLLAQIQVTVIQDIVRASAKLAVEGSANNGDKTIT